ncbi:hypothetical protein Q8F55_007072 [Vanrija albida]|uniref:DUF7729 domain-containing protein n=1 Tax=Vanrija albida TaxID=181172 RepID=A0ABR3PYW3_9TREE
MKYTLATLTLASVAIAASSPLVPSSASQGCQTFLNTLNSDSALQNCVNPLLTATNSFNPASGSAPSGSQVASTLATLCKASGCDATLRDALSQFASQCNSDLTSGNKDVIAVYDALYVFTPLKGAVCAIDSGTQNYCVSEIQKGGAKPAAGSGKPATGPANSTVHLAEVLPSYLQVPLDLFSTVVSQVSKRTSELIGRAPATNQLASIVTPNATTYQSTNLPFLFLQPSFSQAQLCTPCTREVFVSYISWESKQPYALGLAQSPILGGQNKLWDAITNTCGAAFVNAITAEAGVNAAANTGSGALQRIGVPAAGTLAAVFAVVMAF